MTEASDALGLRAPRWLAEAVRITIIDHTLNASVPIFKTIVGIDPDEQVSRATPRQLNEIGLSKDYRINILQQIGRIDVVLADDPSTNTIDPSIPRYKPFFHIGAYEQALAFAKQLGDNVVSEVAQLQLNEVGIKVAFAPTIICPVTTIVEGNRLLASLLPAISFNADNDTDIFWQINRPRHSKLDGRLINRLSKWHLISIRAVGLFSSQTAMSGPIKMAVRAELEANFEAPGSMDRSELTLRSHFDELFEIVTELARDGDIP